MSDKFSDPIVPEARSSVSPHPVARVKHVVLHVEVALKEEATCRFDAIRPHVEQYLRDNYTSITIDSEINSFQDYAPVITNNVERISIVEVTGSSELGLIRLAEASLDIHVYQLHQYEDQLQENDMDDATATEYTLPAASLLALPAKSLEGLWDTLVFEDDLKNSLLHYISTILLFSDRKVNTNLVSFQRLVLLYGPPGTGKTSLCRALAQKIAIRFSHRYSHGRLIEVNASSLFSRFYSESSKMVGSLFGKIYETTEDEELFVCVLVDEIETLTKARVPGSSEPSDSMRVVNVLLTQLDRLKRRSNVLVLTTSNLLDASDCCSPQICSILLLIMLAAFLDRTDVIQYVGCPGVNGVYQILRTSLEELMRSGIVEKQRLISYDEAMLTRWTNRHMASSRLLSICEDCAASQRSKHELSSDQAEIRDSIKRPRDLSGRGLRRLLMLAHARHIRSGDICSLERMLEAMHITIKEEFTCEAAKK